MNKKILIVEDEKRLRDLLRDYLSKEGYNITLANHGEEGLDFALKYDFDLILLDVMMPFMDGLEMLKELRKTKSTRVFFLTAKAMDEDFIDAYEIGADDYITKPFSPKILVLKINNLFQRLEEDTNQKSDITFGRLTINPSSKRVFIDDVEIYLSKKEMELLLYFTQNVDQVLLRDAMITAVWGYDYDGGQSTIDTSIKRLREKLGPLSGYVQTVRGYGYRFTVNDDV
ncbi:MAG: response regulator transcription factor [Clostridium sp.]|nr:response regulator transcription factor [Clostridium sp.]